MLMAAYALAVVGSGTLLYDYLQLGEVTFLVRFLFEVLPFFLSSVLMVAFEADKIPQPKTLYDGLDRLEEDDDVDN